MGKVVKSWKKLEKWGKVGKSGEKLGKVGEKWGKVGEKWGIAAILDSDFCQNR